MEKTHTTSNGSSPSYTLIIHSGMNHTHTPIHPVYAQAIVETFSQCVWYTMGKKVCGT